MNAHTPRACLLCGGFGGARFGAGLLAAAEPGQVAIVTNPGDDLSFLGLTVWPDFDSVLYGAAGLFDEDLGWGVRGDTTMCADALGQDAWFRMGDRDLALSMRRTGWLEESLPYGEVARRCCSALGVSATIVPAAAEPHRTKVRTDRGWHTLQEYLVRERAQPEPRELAIEPRARSATPEALAALAADLLILGPSNPLTSLMPILTTPQVAALVLAHPRVIAISPVVSAVPPRRPPEISRFRVRELMLATLGVAHSATGAASLYSGMIDGIVIDERDAAEAQAIEAEGSMQVLQADLLAEDAAARRRLAEEVLGFGFALPERTEGSRQMLNQALGSSIATGGSG